MVSRLKMIDNHEALFLLQNCFSVPKLTYFLRTAPCFLDENILITYDKIIHQSLIDILNIQILDAALNQATLPISKGGLGLRPAMEVALSGFLSSMCATEKLTGDLLPFQNNQPNLHFDLAIQKWKDLSGLESLPENKVCQSEWDKGLYEHRFEIILQNTQEDPERARILSVSSECSSDWINAVPIPSLGLHLDPMTLKIS